MKRLTTLLAALSAVAVFAGAEDSPYELTSLLPLDIYETASPNEWSAQNATALYPASGGFVEPNLADRPSASDNNGVTFRLEHASCGMLVSEQQADFSLGDWCTYLPVEDSAQIDWERTGQWIRSSPAYLQEGRVYYNNSATSDYQRVLFTRGGTTTLHWFLKDGSELERVYQVSSTAKTRPYRLFWTESPFSAPKVSLSGKFTRLLGDPEIVRPKTVESVISRDPFVTNTNIVRGVVYDESTETLRAYAQTLDVDTFAFDGPEGQFVLAYYDTGAKDNLIYTVVVEVAQPDVNVIPASVGDILRPIGSGYDTTNMTANIRSGLASTGGGDANAPYLYQHRSAAGKPKDGAVFAIAPTDGTSAQLGVDSPWKAEIWWQVHDPAGTSWPFEDDQYLISWGDMATMVTSGGASDAGILVPDDYTVEVMPYSDPAAIAGVCSNVVSVTRAGRFLLKLSTADDIWSVPVRACLNTDTNVFDRAAGEVYVGQEIKPRADAAAGISADLAARIDDSLPGYVHVAGSTGRNWNPRLYHEPVLLSEAEQLKAAQDADDPYANLASAIYAVNASASPIEVWWYRTYQVDGMPAPLRIPTVPQLYTAVWPDPEETREIVLASERGTAAPSFSCEGRALFLAQRDAHADTSDLRFAGEDGAFTFGFFVNASPHAASHPEIVPGALFALKKGADPYLSADIKLVDGAPELTFSLPGSDFSSDAFGFPLASNEWTHVAFAVESGKTTVFKNGRKVDTLPFPIALSGGAMTNDCRICIGNAETTATGLAVDEITVWSRRLGDDELAAMAAGETALLSEARYRWSFDGPEDLRHAPVVGVRTAKDAVLSRLMTLRGCLAMEPGGPTLASGVIPSRDEVAPRVYVQNDPAQVGYNPNEEHAFLHAEDGGFVAYALRCDLNTATSSRPFVLVEYNDAGKGAMRIFDVQLTNAVHATFASDVTVGNLLVGPHPLDFLDGYYNEKNYCCAADTNDDRFVIHRDKYNRMWARRDGTTSQYNFYPVQEGFFFPSLETQPPVGTLVGWLNCLSVTNPTLDSLTSLPPLPWEWRATWPADDKIPTMRIGQTLSTAVDGLPEVWNASSMAVAYPVPRTDGTNRADTVVTLIDPTVARTASLPFSDGDFPKTYGFTVGNAGNVQLRNGRYFFTGLPPTLSDRFYVDINASESNRMVLVGQKVERASGSGYLQLNVLSDADRAALKALCPLSVSEPSGNSYKAWCTAVDALAVGEVQPSTRQVEDSLVRSGYRDGTILTLPSREARVSYMPVDHYALVANGCGTNYVTLIENDSSDESMVSAGAPVAMHVLKVVPELHADRLIALQDPNNKLSEQLNILYAAPFGDAAKNFDFEWRRTTPPTDGHVPEDYANWPTAKTGRGLTDLLLGGQGANLAELVNTYYVMRYRARPGTPAHAVTGDTWSDWCGATLAEGWVQRVLNNVTPFAQRISNFYDNAAELLYTMPEQIGRPYRGDVALNDANLEDIGLLELYQTVLNKAESLSLSLGLNDPNANKQLMEAASRLADLYALLGDEAYSDSKNPTIGVWSTGGLLEHLEFLPGSTFCFQNQVPTLLDEELALLRGRTRAVAPNLTTYPCYNRLMWNFTKGITEGEAAYVVNYLIAAEQGELTVDQAAEMYPQGHGDAYGHYLSAVWGYYRLLRNPNFAWGDPSMLEMLVGESVVNMDYADERKFATIAAKLARTGADVVDLTARKAWRDQGGRIQSGYFDADREQGFGYGEWGVRTGLGALYHWATVNSLLPPEPAASPDAFDDESIKDIDRSKVGALEELARTFEDVEAKLNRLDAGLNPLGLSQNAVPFDIDPSEKAPHFEQILARAEKALDNTDTVLGYANTFASRLAQISKVEAEDAEDHETVEQDYRNRLVAIFGTPYPGDIGPAGTYVQGYDGPDIYHYTWMDLSPYGLTGIDLRQTKTVTTYKKPTGPIYLYSDLNKTANNTYSITYTIAPGGISVKPANITGTRATEGSIQAAYRDFLAAYVNVQHAKATYDAKVTAMENKLSMLKTKFGMAQTELSFKEIVNAAKAVDNVLLFTTQMLVNSLTMADELGKDTADLIYKSSPKIIGAGLTVNYDPSSVAAAVSGAAYMGVHLGLISAKSAAKVTKLSSDLALGELKLLFDSFSAGFAFYDTQCALYDAMCGVVGDVTVAAQAVQDAYAGLVAAEATYRAAVAEGNRLLTERETWRQHCSNAAVGNRYQDMYYRIQRNSALAKYDASFETAQRYVWELAKVYDYETGLLSGDPQAGDAFLASVIGTRALGTKGVTMSADGSDGGLHDLVARMSANWDVLKGRLGVNNPNSDARWFSLRYSLFRIAPGAEGDAAWRRELEKYWVDDIRTVPEFARHCQPPEDGSAVPLKRPGLVISFSTTIDDAKNFFGRTLQGGEGAFSSSDYATKIANVGVSLEGYQALCVQSAEGLAVNPNVYLVPVGTDYMRAPAGTSRRTIGFNVVDQVLPLPYAVGSTELDDDDWVSTFAGLDGTSDAYAKIRRHSTLVANGAFSSTRLHGRSVWNSRWLLVIPASALNADGARGLRTFIDGLDSDKDGKIDIPGVRDIAIGIQAYSRQGN